VCFLLVFMLCTGFRGDGARILGIFPSASPSHRIVYQVIMKRPVARGHQVTAIGTEGLKVRVQGTFTHSVARLDTQLRSFA